jgi:P-type Ca2+ transporter type 2C
VPITMGYAVIGLGTAWAALVFRPGNAPAWEQPLFQRLLLTAVPMALIVVSTELGLLQRLLDTLSLSGDQWLACFALSLPYALAVELDKLVNRRRVHAQQHQQPAPLPA